MANSNTKYRNSVIRDKAKAAQAAHGGNFKAAQAAVIEEGSARKEVTMYFTSKWEGNSAHRVFGL